MRSYSIESPRPPRAIRCPGGISPSLISSTLRPKHYGSKCPISHITRLDPGAISSGEPFGSDQVGAGPRSTKTHISGYTTSVSLVLSRPRLAQILTPGKPEFEAQRADLQLGQWSAGKSSTSSLHRLNAYSHRPPRPDSKTRPRSQSRSRPSRSPAQCRAINTGISHRRYWTTAGPHWKKQPSSRGAAKYV